MKRTRPAARVAVFLSLASFGCGVPEDEGQGDPPSRVASALRRGDYRCEPLSAQALAVRPPPAPAPVLVPGDEGAWRAAGASARTGGDAAVPVPPTPELPSGGHEGERAPLCPPGKAPRAANLAALPPRLGPPSPTTRSGSGEGAAVGADAPVVAGATYYYATVVKPTAEAGARSGVGARIQIVDPVINHVGDMVTSQISIVEGSNTSVVEVGLRKFQTPGPTLLVGSWVGGTFRDLNGWVQVHPSYYPNMSLQAYMDQSVPFYIRYDQGNWWVWFKDGWVGYFPGSNWGGAFTGGDMAHWYGEVYDADSSRPPLTDMGKGILGSSPNAAVIDEMCVHSTTHLCYYINNAQVIMSDYSYYDVLYPGGAFMRYGGHGGGY